MQRRSGTALARGGESRVDAAGGVDAAIYARPHVFDDGSGAIVMRERLTHGNVDENPRAAYLFTEDSASFSGVRLFLRRLREETDHPSSPP